MSDELPLERIDSFAYRHRVSEVMGTPLATSRPGATIAEAAKVMSLKGISSLVVVDEAGRPVGIVTERDVLKAVAEHRNEAADVPLGAVMSSPVATVRSDAFTYVAMGRMDRLRLRHLVAVDEQGVGAGVVTLRGLMHMRSSTALLVGDEVEAARSAEDMRKAKAKLPRLAAELLAERVEALGVAAVLSSVLRALTERAARLAEQAMEAEGWGKAPAQWCLLLLGSGGRREGLFGADQDNAIVHAGGPGDDPWFAELGKRICDILNTAGVPFCGGGVMACNAEWRHDVAGWDAQIQRWIRGADGKELLNVHIFVDFRPVHGDIGLASDLRRQLTEQAARSPQFLHAMAQAAGDIKAPLGILGQFITRNGRLDIKMAGLLPLTSAARVLALKHRIEATGTGERLRLLAEGGHMSAGEAAAFRESHELMVRILLEQQQADLAAGLPLSNAIDPKRLKSGDRDRLKQAFKAINALMWSMKNSLS
ncbi:putative signal transduction protein [Paramagnetospirillum caucaseum]|uniref:Putative signal transduction protein n=1 Tax=Paramagnetospirillum caucaseum TaxID=1244869 RepID=M3AGM3_9PROT|nr:putative nucleotidyltransferase substrate binding domain-containing protein [Paramagnetospirillum caucaseum]EME72008.1 putative signal transduction protein [Paramagnetospirillum caucaseum]